MHCECKRVDGKICNDCPTCLDHKKREWLQKPLENFRARREASKLYGLKSVFDQLITLLFRRNK